MCVYRALLCGVALAVGGCASATLNTPINQQIQGEPLAKNWLVGNDQLSDLRIVLAFSGGGTRAAAFAHGVLLELDSQTIATSRGPRPMSEAISVIAGVSGGSVAAAYYGLHGRAGLRNFRQEFLLANAEAGFDTTTNLGSVLKILNAGGLNDVSRFPKWLDDNVFHGSTFRQFSGANKPAILITASDIYNRTPFVFHPDTFGALCSNLSTLKIADAVAASAAVPGVFLPINVENFSPGCGYKMPGFMERSLASRDGSATLKATALSLDHYRTGGQKYVKLLDGGLTDNFGIQPLSLARSDRDRAYAPMTAEAGAKLKRVLVIVVDAGRGAQGDWNNKLEAPSALKIAAAATDTTMESSVLRGYDYFRLLTRDWEAQLKSWRCGLATTEVKKLRGSLMGWRCDDVAFAVGRLSFDDLSPEIKNKLDAIETRFSLPQDQVDLLIESGRYALRHEPAFLSFTQGRH